MKKLLFLFLLTVVTAHSQDLKQLRSAYPTINESEVATNALFDKLSAISKKNSQTKLAYKGAVLTLKGKFAKGVKNKKNYFKQGVKLLEDAVTAEPDNIEIRCLRLGVQENSPKILKYKQHISEDKKYLLEHYASVSSTDLQKFIKGYVALSKAFTEVEKQLF